jgi:uncharacterized delta-60 repeat protein
MPAPSRSLRVEPLEDRTTPSTLPVIPPDAALDPTFGTGGIVNLLPDTPPPLTQSTVPKVVGLPGGGAYVLGSFSGHWFVERLTPTGAPDPTFGTNGRAQLIEVSTPEERFSFSDLAVTPDGGVVAVGLRAPFTVDDPTSALAVLKLTATGQPDAAFDANAAMEVGFGPGADGSAAANAVAVAADGSIFVAGTGYKLHRLFLPGGEFGNPARAGVVKFRPDGTPDTTFDGDGAMWFGVEATGFHFPPETFAPETLAVNAFDVAVDAKGRVFLSGSTVHVSGFVVYPLVTSASFNSDGPEQPFAARLTADGQLDSTFADHGIIQLTPPAADPNESLGGGPTGRWVGLEPDGTAVVGMLDQRGSTDRLAVAHLSEAGAIDPAFGDQGYAVVDDTRGFSELAVAPDGSIVAVTSNDSYRYPVIYYDDGVPRPRPDFVVAPTEPWPEFVITTTDTNIYRFTAGGVVAAVERLPVGSPEHPVVGASVGISSDGRVTVAAVADNLAADDARILVARLDEMLAPPLPPPAPPPPAPPPPAPPPPSVLVPAPGGQVHRFDLGPDGKFQDAASMNPFPGFTGEVRTAAADVNGDGFDDLIFVTGPGTPVRFTVISGKDGSTVLVPPTDPFGGDFTGGAFVAAGDLGADVRTGNVRARVVLAPDMGGGPNVVIFSFNADGSIAGSEAFFALGNPDFRGGARPAVGDLNGDGFADLAVGAGFLGGPNVEVHDGRALAAGDFATLIGSQFFAFDGPDAATLRNGVFLTIGDVNGDGFADLIVGGGPGGGPRVLALDGKMLATGNVAGALAAPVANFFAGDESTRGGVQLAAVKRGDNLTYLVAQPGDASAARVYPGHDISGSGEPSDFQALDPLGASAAGNPPAG